MPKSRLLLAALAATVAAVTYTASAPDASAQGGYFGQRATQDRDYSRMSTATQRAWGTKSASTRLAKNSKAKKSKVAKAAKAKRKAVRAN